MTHDQRILGVLSMWSRPCASTFDVKDYAGWNVQHRYSRLASTRHASSRKDIILGSRSKGHHTRFKVPSVMNFVDYNNTRATKNAPISNSVDCRIRYAFGRQCLHIKKNRDRRIHLPMHQTNVVYRIRTVRLQAFWKLLSPVVVNLRFTICMRVFPLQRTSGHKVLVKWITWVEKLFTQTKFWANQTWSSISLLTALFTSVPHLCHHSIWCCHWTCD